MEGLRIVHARLGLDDAIQQIVFWTMFLLLSAILLSSARIIGQALPSPYGPLAIQVFLGFIWLGAGGYGLLGRRHVYRRRYGRWAYRQAVLHFGIIAWAAVVATLAYPVYVKGEPLLPPVVVDIVKTYLLLAAVILYVKGLIALGIARGLAVYVYFPEEDRPIYSQIYAYIRHPIYSASIHIALWIGCEANNLVAFACSLFTIACLLLWVRLEELELVERFGDSYRRYRAEVPAFFPKRQQVGPFLRCLALDW